MSVFNGLVVFSTTTSSIGSLIFLGLPLGLVVFGSACVGLLVLDLPSRFVFSPPVSSLTFCVLIAVPPEAPLSDGISGFVFGGLPLGLVVGSACVGLLVLDLGGSSGGLYGLGLKLLEDAVDCIYGKSLTSSPKFFETNLFAF